MKAYKYLLTLSTIKFVLKAVSYIALIMLALSINVALAAVLGVSLVASEGLSFLMAKELDRIQQETTNNFMAQLQEEAILSQTQDNWN